VRARSGTIRISSRSRDSDPQRHIFHAGIDAIVQLVDRKSGLAVPHYGWVRGTPGAGNMPMDCAGMEIFGGGLLDSQQRCAPWLSDKRLPEMGLGHVSDRK